MSKQCPSVSLKSCFYCKRCGNHRSICPTRCERSSTGETSLSLASSEDSESEQKVSDMMLVVSNALLASGERVLLHR